MTERPSTPPPQTAPSNPGLLPRSPLTPEQVRNIEINRLKAKTLRAQREFSGPQNNAPFTRSSSTLTPNNLAAGQKRPYASTTAGVTSTLRDARPPFTTTPHAAAKPAGFRPLDEIQPARNFTKYVEYDFSKMTDTKGGFLTAEDDPHNKALHALRVDEKPAHMTMKEWERHQLLRQLREQKAGPFEPGLSVLSKGGKGDGDGDGGDGGKKCRECGSLEIDWKWEEVFRCAVCNKCKEKFPEKYSLLTKTEAREDYLLTEPELKDEELLPRLERPNPHKSTWNNMMLYLRYQVEEYAFSERKWGGEGRLDEEFEKREGEKKRRKEGKFRAKLQELKRKTRVEAYRRGRRGEGGREFGDEVGRGGKHTHVWGRPVEGDDGVGTKTCVECGMEVEELEF